MTNEDFDNCAFVFYDAENNKISTVHYNKQVKLYEVQICGTSGTKLHVLMGFSRLQNFLNPLNWTQIGIL